MTNTNLQEWEDKLMGKKIVPLGGSVKDPAKEFAENEIKDGVEFYRILKPNSRTTRDFLEDRLNVHIDDETSIVQRVSLG